MTSMCDVQGVLREKNRESLSNPPFRVSRQPIAFVLITEGGFLLRETRKITLADFRVKQTKHCTFCNCLEINDSETKGHICLKKKLSSDHQMIFWYSILEHVCHCLIIIFICRTTNTSTNRPCSSRSFEFSSYVLQLCCNGCRRFFNSYNSER